MRVPVQPAARAPIEQWLGETVAELQARIVHCLAAEWDWIARELEWEHGDRLVQPVFTLTDQRALFGTWCADTREIQISQFLATEHPWHCVVRVLRHEMAHQFVTEILRVTEERHGPAFRKACELFRADPRAATECELIEDGLRRDEDAGDNRIMVKVRKLLALAQSPVRSEAEQALAKAHDLIARYNIGLLTQGRAGEYQSLCVGTPAVRRSAEQQYLARLLGDFYFVQCIWVHTFCPDKGKLGRILEITGRPENLRIASYVHDFVERFIRVEWERYATGPARGLTRRRRTDFAVGVLTGFIRKLESGRTGEAAGPAGCEALVKVEDTHLREHFRQRYPRICTLRGSARQVDRNVLRDGQRIGGQLIIHRGVEPGRQDRGLLLDA